MVFLWPLLSQSRYSAPGCRGIHSCFSTSGAREIPKDIFFHMHNISHPGRLASQRLVSSRYVWRSLAKDVPSWAKTCLHCQQSIIHCHARTQPLQIPVPQRCFSHLHVGLVGRLQYSNNCNYIFTMIDCTSKWMEAVPLSEISAADCAQA